VVLIRPIRPDDAAGLEDFHEHLSAETVYKRFFSAHPHLRAEEIQRFTSVDYRNRLALVAEHGHRLVGVARYDSSQGTSSAEVAFVISDALQGHGLGTLLLEHLASAARHRGVSGFAADTLFTNYQMQEVFRDVGFQRRVEWGDGVSHVSFPITPTQGYLDAVLSRHFVSTGAWLEPRIERLEGLGAHAVCLSRESAKALEAAGAELSSLVVVDDATLGLAGLAADNPTGLVMVELGELRLPGRFIAMARASGQSLTIVTVDPAHRYADVCRQAGIRRAGSWREAIVAGDYARSGKRGSLIEFPDCEVGTARRLLDQAAARLGPVNGLALLEAGSVGELFHAYTIGHKPALKISIGDDSGGVAIRTTDPRRPVARAFLPLTDTDGEYLAGKEAEAVLRLGRLLDDHPDVRRVELSSDGARQVWIGPRRGSQDDPFVRRLPDAGPGTA
jgi:GNAT superfamily N-acetyltransferase